MPNKQTAKVGRLTVRTNQTFIDLLDEMQTRYGLTKTALVVQGVHLLGRQLELNNASTPTLTPTTNLEAE